MCNFDGSYSVAQAIDLQRQLADRVSFGPLAETVRSVGAADVTFCPNGKNAIAVVVVLSFPGLEPLDRAEAIVPVEFPYVPGLLSFRELPAVLAAYRRLATEPDVLMADGQGFAHPRRFGLACHLGVSLDTPTIGCAKSRLIGTYRQPGIRKGCCCRLMDGDEQIGAVVRSRTAVKWLYVSVGHKIELQQAIRIVLRCCDRYRLPKPAHMAHRLVSRLRSDTANSLAVRNPSA